MTYCFKQLVVSGLLCSGLAVPAAAQVNCDMGEPAPNMPEGFAQFDFMVGDFVVMARRMTADGWSPSIPLARWNGRYALNGRAVMDWWHTPKDSGINIRLYDETGDLWKTAWTHTANLQTKELHQKFDPETGRMKLWQVYPEGDERRIYFETYADGGWARIDGRKDEDTGEWRDSIKLEAVPTPCIAGQSHMMPEPEAPAKPAE
ncbi:hypothetical protein GCM10007853_16590 [Algimonas ampicilliniresistens]|uniref:Uncharacterized protein n=1 Tax=Algimonas ampicilliniresistens TaxID=1298735 RepID=A0ABQ5V9R0_9PROT|nr:hypothetical protein [Algimonas ampicilliniresistens]GLQ23785.1 hypothetical protein GCM10007853_16590 [Algimonas ampicilliniresistens]